MGHKVLPFEPTQKRRREAADKDIDRFFENSLATLLVLAAITYFYGIPVLQYYWKKKVDKIARRHKLEI